MLELSVLDTTPTGNSFVRALYHFSVYAPMEPLLATLDIRPDTGLNAGQLCEIHAHPEQPQAISEGVGSASKSESERVESEDEEERQQHDKLGGAPVPGNRNRLNIDATRHRTLIMRPQDRMTARGHGEYHCRRTALPSPSRPRHRTAACTWS